MKNLFFSILLISPFALNAQTLHLIKPSDTDSEINIADENHWVYINEDVTPKNKLFVFLPGTFGFPALYTRVLKTAANLGYHSVGLNYPNPVAINVLCALSSDTTCHARARHEIFDGIERHNGIHVDRPNSIENRLVQLLKHLDNEFPDEDWSQYWTEDSTIVWENILIAGHSQGGGHAGFIGKLKQLERVIMFASMDWMPLPSRTAGWVSMTGETEQEKYFAFTHELDESVAFDRQQIFWEELGMNPSGNIILVDNSTNPYEESHTLFTQLTPAQDSQYHSSVAVDLATPKDGNGVAVFKPVWEYLIDTPLETSIQSVEKNFSGFEIYPNPAFEQVWIISKELLPDPVPIKIYNVLGAEIATFLINEKRTNISLASYSPGIYFLSFGVSENSGQQVVIKMIKH